MKVFEGKVGLFINPDGKNESLVAFLNVLADLIKNQATVISLKETLPLSYRLSHKENNDRLAKILAAAAKESLEEVKKQCKNITLSDDVFLEGRYPKALLEWETKSPNSLLVKQALFRDEGTNVSKGDIKLAHNINIPLLLLKNSNFAKTPVVAAIAPSWDENEHDSFWVELLQTAAGMAAKFGSPLHVVHAWEMFGESFLSAKMTLDEIKGWKKEVENQAAKAADRILAQAKGLSPEPKVFKVEGEPTKVLQKHAKDHNPSLIVMGSAAEKNIRESLVGNTAESLIRYCPHNILMLKDKA